MARESPRRHGPSAGSTWCSANPRYAALAVFNGEIVARGHWPAYITERQHTRILARMATYGSKKKPVGLETYLLKRLGRCGVCGEPMYCVTGNRHRDNTLTRRYVCASHTKDRSATRCAAPRISADMLEAMLIASLRTLLLDGLDEDRDNIEREQPAVYDVSRERQQIRDAALHGDEQSFSAALEQLVARSAEHAGNLANEANMPRRRARQLEAVPRFDGWAAQQLAGRTDDSRAEEQKLNRLLRTWFSQLTVTMDETSVLITARHRTPTGQHSTQAEVHIDRSDWARVAWHTDRPRLRRQGWDDSEILGALQGWAETHSRSPTPIDWVHADTNHPSARTVRAHFVTWKSALRHAGLEPHVPDTPPKSYPWTDSELIHALRQWAAAHGHPPNWHKCLRAQPGQPCNSTICQHFGGWKAGLEAAGLAGKTTGYLKTPDVRETAPAFIPPLI
jgi:hypothetical protein